MTSTAPGRLAYMTGLTPLAATTTCADPQAAYRQLREQWGVVAPVQLEGGVNAWLVMGYEEICHVVRHERLFSRDPHNWRDLSDGIVAPDSGLGPMMFPRDNAYFKDGDVHRRLRAPLATAVRGGRGSKRGGADWSLKACARWRPPSAAAEDRNDYWIPGTYLNQRLAAAVPGGVINEYYRVA